MTDPPRRLSSRIERDRLKNVAHRGTPGSDDGRTATYKPVRQRLPRGPIRGGSITVVVHNDDDSVDRPNSAVVYWIGSATPTNAEPFDIWYTADIT